MVDVVIRHPLVMIASDGDKGHPRNAGTYSQILARYVRHTGSITLMDAIRKMSLMPAQRMEKSTPAARLKGRLQEGADADVVVFDPEPLPTALPITRRWSPALGCSLSLSTARC